MSLAVFLLFIVVYTLFGSRIQFHLIMSEVGSHLRMLSRMRQILLARVTEFIRKNAKDDTDVEGFVSTMTDYFVVEPVSLDPSGVVWKLEHLIRTAETHLENSVRGVLANPCEDLVKRATYMIEVARAFSAIHKIVNHFYILARKTNNLFIAMQLHFMLPLIAREANALFNAVQAFELRIPIGDGAGVLAVSHLVTRDAPYRTIARHTICYETSINGRPAFIIRPKGPEGNTGELGRAVEHVLAEIAPSAIITVDAAVKLEGEKTGSIAIGTGVAIGGVGVQRFRIEEIASKHHVPCYAIVIKMSSSEALLPMNEAIAEASRKAAAAVERLVSSLPVGEPVVVVGVGNSLGIGV